MGRGERGGDQTKRDGRWAGREGQRPNKEGGRSGGARVAAAKQRGQPIRRGERGNGETKRAADGRGERGSGQTKRAADGRGERGSGQIKRAADVAGREGRRRKIEGRPMWQGEKGGGERKRGG